MSLQQLPWDKARDQLRKLVFLFPEYEHEYRVDLVNDASSFIGINRSMNADPLRTILHALLPEAMAVPDLEHSQMRGKLRRLGFSDAELPPRSLVLSSIVDHTARFLLALIGGSFLLVPIIVMNFVDSQNMRLVVASVFVLAFSLFLSFLSRASNQEILGGSAAYAAVLVVFVGSALSSST
jgi:hypothetical protein